jgi:hypothetical protein
LPPSRASWACATSFCAAILPAPSAIEKFRANFVRSRCDGRAVKALCKKTHFHYGFVTNFSRRRLRARSQCPAIHCSECPTPQI